MTVHGQLATDAVGIVDEPVDRQSTLLAERQNGAVGQFGFEPGRRPRLQLVAEQDRRFDRELARDPGLAGLHRALGLVDGSDRRGRGSRRGGRDRKRDGKDQG